MFENDADYLVQIGEVRLENCKTANEYRSYRFIKTLASSNLRGKKYFTSLRRQKELLTVRNKTGISLGVE